MNIQNLKTEYEQINQQLGTTTDPLELKKLSQRHAQLSKIMDVVGSLERVQKQLKENQELLNSEEDGELKAMAQEEIEKLQPLQESREQELKRLLVPKDPLDVNDAILEIRAGTGGDEAALFASELLRMYTRYAESLGWKAEVDSINKTDIGGIKEVIVEIKGGGAYGKLKYEGGVHRVQRVPETEKSGRVHTSTASVAVLPSLPEQEFKIDPKDIKIETSTASGHGGQSVNTTYSAIKVTHLPTGITAQSQDERSQHQNKEKALRVMRARVAAYEQEQKDKALRDARRSQIKGAERSDKIRTYNYPQDRITDHRLSGNFHQIELRLDGQIDDIIEQLIELDEKEKLEAIDQ